MLDAFLEAALVPRDRGHATGDLERANEILAANPEVVTAGIYSAAVLGDEPGVRRALRSDPGAATVKGGPRGWDPLTHLCFSRYLRLDRSRSEGFVGAARALLDAGASANTGWIEPNHQPEPEWESVIYGAAGVARHPELTRLLLERGADPNDGETPYHAPETYDNAALEVLVESGKLTPDSLTTILLRKTDWHDHAAIVWLLAKGVDPNRRTHWGKTALHNAVLSDNDRAIVAALLDHGADPTLEAERPDRWRRDTGPRSAIAMAARRGRRDLLELFAARGFPIELAGAEQLLARAALDDEAGIRAVLAADPAAAPAVLNEAGQVLAEFAGVGNTAGVARLLDLGVPVDALYPGDGYFGIPAGSTALHVAAWRAMHDTLKLLIARGAAIDRRDGHGRTPLELAVRACVDSYWMGRRSPESVAALLEAGADPTRPPYPSGYDAVDALLARYRR